MAKSSSRPSSVILGRLEEPWEVKDLPKFPGYAAMFGPGLIWAGLAQGSGELIWWPYMVAKYGLYFVGWLFIFAMLQYWVNLEVGRYTMATGESIYEAFHRIHHLFGWLMFILTIIIGTWIVGYMGGGASALASILGYWPTPQNPKLSIRILTVILVWIIFIIFLLGPVAYKIVEIVEAIAALASFFGMLLAAIVTPEVAKWAGYYFAALFTPRLPLTNFTWTDPKGFTVTWDPNDITVLVTLVCYTGMGGVWNLLYSYWVRDKNAAMTAYIGRVTSPLTGEPEAIPAIGCAFTEKDREEWSKWVKWLWLDNAFGVIFNVLTVLLTSLLSYALLAPEYVPGKEFKLVVVQGRWFAEAWGDIGAIVLWLLAFFFLADSYLGGLDGITRIIVSNLYTNIPSVRERIEYSKLYYIIIFLFTIVATIQTFLKQPGILILMTGIGNMLIMCLYCVALLYFNWFYMPKVHPAGEVIRPSWFVFVMLLISTIVFWYMFVGLYLPTMLFK